MQRCRCPTCRPACRPTCWCARPDIRAGRAAADRGQRQHRRGARGLLPAHHADRQRRHAPAASCRACSRAAPGPGPFAPQLVLPIFDAGRNRASLDVGQRRRATSRWRSTRRRSRRPSAKWPTRWPAAPPAASSCAPSARQAEAEAARFRLSRPALRQRRGQLPGPAGRAALAVHGAAAGGAATRLAQLQNQVRCTGRWAAAGPVAEASCICAMQLHYLDFDFSDEESGRGSFDAMASVVPSRLPALLAEIAAVLGWAGRAFGRAGRCRTKESGTMNCRASWSPIRRWRSRTTRAGARFRSHQPPPARRGPR